MLKCEGKNSHKYVNNGDKMKLASVQKIMEERLKNSDVLILRHQMLYVQVLMDITILEVSRLFCLIVLADT